LCGAAGLPASTSAEPRVVDVTRNSTSGACSAMAAINPRSANTSPRPTACSQTAGLLVAGRVGLPSFSRQRSASSLPGEAALQQHRRGKRNGPRQGQIGPQARTFRSSGDVTEGLLQAKAPEVGPRQHLNEALCGRPLAESVHAALTRAPNDR
jgi:hypothetical protein